jgi:hypothetical protein
MSFASTLGGQSVPALALGRHGRLSQTPRRSIPQGRAGFMSAPESPRQQSGTSATGQHDPATDPGDAVVGTFATGQDDPEAHPEDADVGTFTTGQDDPEAHPEDADVGTFTTGQDDPATYPEDADIGTFADKDDRHFVGPLGSTEPAPGPADRS